MEEVIPASSSWRSHALYTGKRFKKNLITFEKLNDKNIDNITSATHSNCSNLIVLTDTSSKRDVCRIVSVKNNSNNNNNKSIISNNNNIKLQIHSEFIQQSTIKSLSWFNDSLVCGSNDGQIYYYQCDPKSNDDPELKETFTITKLKGFGSDQSSGGGYNNTGQKIKLDQQSPAFSTFIKSVAINPLSTLNFGSIENNFYHYWEFSDAVRPTISFRVSDLPVNCLSYSPHSRNYTAFGCTDNILKITDTRLMSSYASTKKTPIVWSNIGSINSGHTVGANNTGATSSGSMLNRNSYNYGIRDIAWHPYVPYWLASANDHGDISIWDIRNPMFSEPVIEFPAHKGAISKIQWCPMHSELLTSSSYDGEYKLWSLLNEPHYNLFQKDEISPFIYTGFFDNDGYNNFGVSQGGEVYYSNISSKFMGSVQPTKFERSDKSEKQVERLIYNRDFTNGFEKAIALSNKHSRQNQIEKAKNLLSLCFQTNIDDSLSDILKSLQSQITSIGNQLNHSNSFNLNTNQSFSKNDFLNDLEMYSYYIPPGYHERYGTKLSTTLMTKIKELKVNLDIQYHIKNSSGEELMEIEKEIISTLKSDHSSIRIENICELVEVLLNYDSTKCYQFAIQIIEIFKNKLSNIQPMIRLLLHPTIFERKVKLGDSVGILSSSSSSGSNSSNLLSPPTNNSNGGSIPSSPALAKRLDNVRSASVSTGTNSNNNNNITGSTNLNKSPLSNSGNIILNQDIEEFRLSEHLNTPDQMIQQLTFSRDFFKLLQCPTPISDGSNPDFEDIIDFSSKNRPKLLLSMPINRIYLSILSDLYIYDQFYIVLLNLMNTINEEFEFYDILQEHYQQSTPDFIGFIKNSQIRDRLKPWDTEKYSVPLLTCISILYNVPYQAIPSDLNEVLMHAVPSLIQEIDNSLVSTLQQPDPQQSNLSGKQQSSNKSKSLLEFIRTITTNSNNSNLGGNSTPTTNKLRASTSLSSNQSNRTSTSINSPQISLELQSHINSLTLVLNKYI